MKQIALILGGSGGVGKACAKVMAELNYDIVLVYRETRSNQKIVETEIKLLEKTGCEVNAFNLNINKLETINKISEFLNAKGEGCVHVFIHAIADSNVGTLFGSKQLEYDDFVHSFSSMAVSFVNWSQMLVNNNYMLGDGRIIGFTSEGSNKCLNQYAAVGMAKAALETACKYMAVELADRGVAVNLLNAGIMDTKALKAFEDYGIFVENAIKRNPNRRLTTTEDIAKVVGFLVSDAASWITGEFIRVDGGEQLLSIN